MKHRAISVLCAAAATAMLITGCGKGASSAGQESVSQTTAPFEATESEQEVTGAAQEDTDAARKDIGAAQEDTDETAVLEDGVYSAEFDTDTSMFHVNEAHDGKGTLTVEDGRMTIHVSLASKHIVNLFVGTAEDAQTDGAAILEPTTDSVTYSDGYTEDVYGFDIPVPALDREFDVAILGTKGKWYDHKVTVSSPEPDHD